MIRTWLVTGCSTGFGRVLADVVPARGDRSVAMARSVDALADLPARRPDTVRTVALDVTRDGSAASAVSLAETASGGLTSWSTTPGSA